LKQGDHVIASDQLYGRSLTLLTKESARLGIENSVVNTNDPAATAAAFRPTTKMLVVETITNPLLRVSDIAGLAAMAHAHDAKLLVDNTFASPVICRPLTLGADLVMESLSKFMNGHGDVVLGMLCGQAEHWGRVPSVASTFGITAAPFECWLAGRGLGTLHLRMERASDNALRVADFLYDLWQHRRIEAVYYPGLTGHPDHAIAVRQFSRQFGPMVTFTLPGGREAATRFIKAAENIPFCPSLGELCTTLSHPESTSHRGLSAEQRTSLGITGGTIRLSIGTESPEFILDALKQAMDAIAK
jgi:cystathionine beta-lyase/cystathionine gamma-synthase